MSKPVVEVHIRAIAAMSGGFGVFLGNQEKAFVIFFDQSVGAAIAMFMEGTQKERPLTHDLIANILRALGAKIERAIVNDLKLGTYYARLVLSVENELKQKNLIEIDAQPSDCIAMATAQRAPIYVSLEVWHQVEDMTEVLLKMQEQGSHTEESGEEESS
jgi:bifunctional DNase/RNase